MGGGGHSRLEGEIPCFHDLCINPCPKCLSLMSLLLHSYNFIERAKRAHSLFMSIEISDIYNNYTYYTRSARENIAREISGHIPR